MLLYVRNSYCCSEPSAGAQGAWAGRHGKGRARRGTALPTERALDSAIPRTTQRLARDVALVPQHVAGEEGVDHARVLAVIHVDIVHLAGPLHRKSEGQGARTASRRRSAPPPASPAPPSRQAHVHAPPLKRSASHHFGQVVRLGRAPAARLLGRPAARALAGRSERDPGRAAAVAAAAAALLPLLPALLLDVAAVACGSSEQVGQADRQAPGVGRQACKAGWGGSRRRRRRRCPRALPHTQAGGPLTARSCGQPGPAASAAASPWARPRPAASGGQCGQGSHCARAHAGQACYGCLGSLQVPGAPEMLSLIRRGSMLSFTAWPPPARRPPRHVPCMLTHAPPSGLGLHALRLLSVHWWPNWTCQFLHRHIQYTHALQALRDAEVLDRAMPPALPPPGGIRACCTTRMAAPSLPPSSGLAVWSPRPAAGDSRCCRR